MYRVAEALVACGHDIVSGIRPEHGHAALMDQRQQLRQRPGAARFGWVDRAASLALTKLAEGEQPRTEMVGIGVALTPDGDALRVDRVFEGSGAEAATKADIPGRPQDFRTHAASDPRQGEGH